MNDELEKKFEELWNSTFQPSTLNECLKSTFKHFFMAGVQAERELQETKPEHKIVLEFVKRIKSLTLDKARM